MGIIKAVLHECEIDLAGPCSVCGGRAVAYWQGQELIRICHWCAIDILPRLIGDASVAKHDPRHTLNENWSHARGEYYYAAALALERHAIGTGRQWTGMNAVGNRKGMEEQP